MRSLHFFSFVVIAAGMSLMVGCLGASEDCSLFYNCGNEGGEQTGTGGHIGGAAGSGGLTGDGGITGGTGNAGSGGNSGSTGNTGGGAAGGGTNTGGTTLEGADNCGTSMPIHIDARVVETIEGNTKGMTNDTSGKDEGKCSTQLDMIGAFSGDVVYQVSFANKGNAKFSIAGADYDSVLYIREICDQYESQLACDNDKDGDGGEEIEIAVDKDTPVFIWIDGVGGEEGTYTLIINPPP